MCEIGVGTLRPRRALEIKLSFLLAMLELILVVHFPRIAENSVLVQLSSVTDQMASSSECRMRHSVKSQEQLCKGQVVGR